MDVNDGRDNNTGGPMFIGNCLIGSIKMMLLHLEPPKYKDTVDHMTPYTYFSRLWSPHWNKRHYDIDINWDLFRVSFSGMPGRINVRDKISTGSFLQ